MISLSEPGLFTVVLMAVTSTPVTQIIFNCSLSCTSTFHLVLLDSFFFIPLGSAYFSPCPLPTLSSIYHCLHWTTVPTGQPGFSLHWLLSPHSIPPCCHSDGLKIRSSPPHAHRTFKSFKSFLYSLEQSDRREEINRSRVGERQVWVGVSG